MASFTEGGMAPSFSAYSPSLTGPVAVNVWVAGSWVQSVAFPQGCPGPSRRSTTTESDGLWT